MFRLENGGKPTRRRWLFFNRTKDWLLYLLIAAAQRLTGKALALRNEQPQSSLPSGANRSATWKAAENGCLERRNSVRPCVPSHVAYKAERGGNELFWSPWKNVSTLARAAPKPRGNGVSASIRWSGPRLGRRVRIYKCS